MTPKSAASAAGRSPEILLDTCTLLWWAARPEQLSDAARRAIQDPSTVVYVSAASAWEIATKVRLGRLTDAGGVTPRLGQYLREQGFRELPIGLAEALHAGGLRIPHQDPFDRMLLTQAILHNLTLVTPEPFGQFGARCLW